jgi:signal transduction histidine kinase
MTIPSMSSSGMRGKEARQSVPLGRVDLLLDSGEVEQSWDIGLGSWSVGSSPQCGISISGDSSIAPRHLELTVGKRYTLLKAPHPIAVAGRIVREFLIDRTTEVECGSRKLRVYPVGFSASELGPVSVVTRERILDVASKLATVQSPNIPPASSQSTVTSDTSLAASSDLKRQLDEMRMALEEMQARISAVSDSEALERRIQSLTSQSISAIEENLGQQMRQPLREELADLLQQERGRWESELQQRLGSLEVQVRQTSSQVDETLRTARQDIGQINQRFQEFVDERGSLRPILNEPQLHRAQASPSDIPYALPSQSEEEGDNEASMYGSDSEERELSPYDSQSFQGEKQDSESYSSEAMDSDEVLEFQVDDESISLRLNRMLGEHVERRPPTEAPKAEGSVINVYNSISVADAAKEISPPTDESSALSGRYLLELNHIQDPVGDAQDSSPKAKGSMDRSTGDKQARGGQLGDSDLGDQSSDEASIEEYMQRLLERVRTGPSGTGATGIPTELPKNAAPAIRAGQRNATVTGSTSASGSRASARVSGSGRTATKPVPEVKSDIQALRELANSNARRAINRSAVRRSSSQGLAKSIIAGAGLLSGVALLLMDVEDTKVKFGGIAVSIIIALVWGFDTCKDIYSMLLNRDKVDQEETPEAAPTGNTSVAKTKKPRETT